ncbi:MAG: DUF4491 family protein [Bacteroidales bacterium]
MTVPEALGELNWMGFVLGLAAFFMIGLFHPVVAKMEYHLGRKSWWMLFFPGLGCLAASMFLPPVASILLGCLAFSLFWSTLELFYQHERVLKGRARRNPKRNYDA